MRSATVFIRAGCGPCRAVIRDVVPRLEAAGPLRAVLTAVRAGELSGMGVAEIREQAQAVLEPVMTAHAGAPPSSPRKCYDAETEGFASVATRRETCAFCCILASLGAVYRTRETAGQFDHYHRRCDCKVEPGFENDPMAVLVEVHDPRRMSNIWEIIEGSRRSSVRIETSSRSELETSLPASYHACGASRSKSEALTGIGVLRGVYQISRTE